MSGAVLLVIFAFAALVFGIMTVFGAPVLAIPIILLLPGLVFGLEVLRRQARQHQIARFRKDARAQKIDFDESDQSTLSR